MKKLEFSCVLCVLMFFIPLGLVAQGAITEKNWTTHPDVVEVRGIFTEVEKAISQSKWAAENHMTDGAYANPVIFWRDATKVIRKLSTEFGSEDSAVTLDHYYDAKGVLRFVFGKAGAVNGTTMEYRVYYGRDGKRFWHNLKQTAGPGYTFPEIMPEDWTVSSPEKFLKGE